MVIAIVSGCVSASHSEPEAGFDELQNIQKDDRACFEKFDQLLSTLWTEKLNEVKVDDLGSIPRFLSFDTPINSRYNTRFQEWLLEADNLTEKLRQCSAGLYESVSNKFDNDTRICADRMLKRLIENEVKFEGIAEKQLNFVDLPFRKFLTFDEFNVVVFQNRSIDHLTDVERNTYEDMQIYMSDDKDKEKRVWNLRQRCDWEDLRSIKEAKDDEELWNSFKKILLKSHDRELAHNLITNINVDALISHKKIEALFNSTNNMKSAIDVLKPIKNDSRSYCEYASDLGRRFASKQSKSLLDRSNRLDFLDLTGYHIVGAVTSVRNYLKKADDPRRDHFKKLGDRLAEDFNCWWSVMILLLNQQRYEIATNFVSNELSYPDVVCSSGPVNPKYLTPQYCECNGSFCQKHIIAQLFEEKYELKKNDTSGNYHIVHL